MEFSLRVGDMSFFDFCKFEIVIFKILQTMTEHIIFIDAESATHHTQFDEYVHSKFPPFGGKSDVHLLKFRFTRALVPLRAYVRLMCI